MANKSEVAALLVQIDTEFQAGHLAIHGFAEGTTRHAFITKRMEHMYEHMEELRKKFGLEGAMQAFIAWQDGAASQESRGTTP